MNIDSEVKLLIIFNPFRVSSTRDKNSPCSFWTLLDFLFNDFPMNEIIKPEIGIKIKTKSASLLLIRIIDASVKIIISGSFTINSKIPKNDVCSSITSEEILDKTSPFFFSE